MRHAASALLVALASASQPPGGWPGYNNYPPPPPRAAAAAVGRLPAVRREPQYGSEAVEPATADDDADAEAVEADVVAEPANETAVEAADADDEAPSTEPEVEVAEYAYDDGRGTPAYYGEVRAEYQAPSPSEPEQEPEAPTTGGEAVPPCRREFWRRAAAATAAVGRPAAARPPGFGRLGLLRALGRHPPPPPPAVGRARRRAAAGFGRTPSGPSWRRAAAVGRTSGRAWPAWRRAAAVGRAADQAAAAVGSRTGPGVVGPAAVGERRAAAGAAARTWLDGPYLSGEPKQPEPEPGLWPGPIWRAAGRRRAAVGRATSEGRLRDEDRADRLEGRQARRRAGQERSCPGAKGLAGNRRVALPEATTCRAFTTSSRGCS